MPGKDTVNTVEEAGWASGTVWTGAENLAPTGVKTVLFCKINRHPVQARCCFRKTMRNGAASAIRLE